MVSINNAFPSNYIKAADLQGKHVRAQIDRVAFEDIGGEQKLVMFFKGKTKGMVLNKTNAATIAGAYGEETDDWNGAEIELFSTKTLFQGKMVDAVRINIPPQSAPQRRSPPQRQAEPPVNGQEPPYDDDIPF